MTDSQVGLPTQRDWTALWESAASAAVEGLPDRTVYTGPAWEVPNTLPSTPSRVWKMAVLERKPGGGAEHWGHILIVVSAAPSEVVIRPERAIHRGVPPIAVETLLAPEGVGWEIRIRPLSSETAPRLRNFAMEFQRHATGLVRGASGYQEDRRGPE